MPLTLATAFGYVAAALTSGLAVYYFRRSTGLYSLLVEGANRFEETRVRLQSLEMAAAKSEDRFKSQREHSIKLESAVEEAREKSAELARKLEAKEHEGRVIAEKLELQKGHLEKMLAKAEAKITGHDAAVASLEEQLRTARVALAASAEELSLRERDWRSRLAEFERDKQSLEKRARSADPAEMRKLKRKIGQYERLYSSMKGLREMTEERNRNWEVALRKLSQWVITEGPGRRGGAAPQEIGPLVGQALTAIGAQLIDERETFSRPEGAMSASTMDDEAADDLAAGLDEAP